jgi:nitrite reductase/ring-hydroxylating ferredoxin subunit
MLPQHHHTIKKIELGLLFLALLFGCATDTSTIPLAPVSLQINLLQVTNLTAIGATESYITASTTSEELGYGGLLVVHTLNDTYCAFDLSCSYEALQTVRVEVQSDLTAKCPVCGSVYRIMDGTGWPISGPSRHKLKQYHVYPDGNYLDITN